MNKLFKYLYLSSIYFFFYLPIAVVVCYSFNNASRSLTWHGFTLQWYTELFKDSALLVSAWHSLVIGLLAATIATLLGTLTAVALFRYKFYGKKVLHALIFILIISPEIVMGIALLILYNFLHISLGFWSLLLAHTTLCVPFVAVSIYSRIVTFNKTIFEAAKDLGANDLTIFLKIIVPLLFPAIIAGWLLSLTLSFDDVIISYFVTGPTFNILPLKIYSMVRIGITPEINALCTILLGITLILVLSAQTALRKKL